MGLQVIEEPDKIVTLKIRNEAHEWVRDEQRSIARAEGAEPTHAELFERMREVYVTRTKPGKSPQQSTGNQPAKSVTLHKSGGEQEVTIAAVDWQWVEQILKTVRAWATELAHGSQNPGTAPPQVDLEKENESVRQTTKEFGHSMEGVIESGEDADRQGEELKPPRKDVRKRRKPDKGRTGGGS